MADRGTDREVVAAPASRAGIAFAVAASLLVLPQALLLGDAVATVAIGPEAGLTGLTGWTLFAALALVGVGRALLDAAATWAAGTSAITAKGNLRRHWLSSFATWSPVAGERAATGDVATMLADRVDGLDPWYVRHPIARWRMMLVPPAIVAVILPISWAVALLLVAAGPFIPIFMALIGARAGEMSRRQLDEAGDLTAMLLDRVGGLATLRSLKAGERTAEAIAARGAVLRERTMEVLAVAFLSSAVLEFFAAAGVAVAAVYIGFHLLDLIQFGGDFGLAGGVAMLALAPEFFQPFRDFAAAYHDKANATALDARAATVFGRDLPRMALRARAAAGDKPPAITVRGLTVRFLGRERPVLDGFALAVAAGSMAAITGPSGAGKSTALAALAGLLDGVEGDVRFNEAPTAPALGWLSQEPVIRQASVLANLSPDGRTVDRETAFAVLERVGLAAVVRRMPRGLLTPLGETGAASRAESSGGWRSREPCSIPPRCCSRTSRPPTSTRTPPRWCAAN